MRFLATLPALFSDSVVDYDGKGGYESRHLRGGETVTTALVIEDMTGGTGGASGSAPVQITLAARTIVVEDNVAPAFFEYHSGNVLVEGSGPVRSVRPGGAAAVQDDQARGDLELRHVLTFETASAEALRALVDDPAAAAIPGAFGGHTVPASAFRPNEPVPLAGLAALAATKVARISSGAPTGAGAATWTWTFEDLASCERLGFVSNLIAWDASGNQSRVQAAATLSDVTAPVVTSVALSGVSATGVRVAAEASDRGDANAGAQTALYAGVYETASAPATDAEARGLFDPATGLFAGAVQSKRLVGGSAAFEGAPALRDLAAHTVLVAAVDSSPARNVSALRREAFATLDGTPPAISSFGATQSPTGYSFSLDAATTRVSDNGNGPLKLYFFLATAAIADADAGAFVATHGGNSAAVAKNEAFAYSAAPTAVAPPALPATSKFWNGSAWTDVGEATLSLTAHLVAIDAAGNGSTATVAKAVNDVTPPTFTGLATGTIAGASVALSWNAVSDLGDAAAAPTATSVYVGVYTAANAGLVSDPAKIVAGSGASGVAGFLRVVQIANNATTTLNVGNGGDGGPALVSATDHFFYAVARDKAGNYSPVLPASARTLDTTDPAVASFAVTQTPGSYEFSATAGTVQDNSVGPLKMYLLMSSVGIATDAALKAAVDSAAGGGLEAGARNLSVPYAANSTLSVATAAAGATTFKTSKFWNGTTYAAIAENAPATPHKLRGYLVVEDAANNLGFGETTEVAVADRGAPLFAGTVALTAEGQTSVKAAWSAAFADARGALAEGRIYYSTDANKPANATAAGVAAWKAASATTSFADVSPLGSLSAGAGSATVAGLTAGTTYHAYLCVKDAAGNELNVQTAPASVATAAPAPQGSSMYIEANRALVTSDPVYVAGLTTVNEFTVSGTDIVVPQGQDKSLTINLADVPSPFTVGVRLKFTNNTVFSTTNNNHRHNMICWVTGSLGGSTPSFNVSLNGFGGGQGLKWNNGSAFATVNSFVRTSFFWFFLVGTPGQSDLKLISYEPNSSTQTVSANFGSSFPALLGILRLNIVSNLSMLSNPVTFDKFFFKNTADFAIANPDRYVPSPTDSSWWSNTANVVICRNGDSRYSNDIGYIFMNSVFNSLGDFSSTPSYNIQVNGGYNGDPNQAGPTTAVTIWGPTGTGSSDTVARRQIALNLLAARNVVWAAPTETSAPSLASLSTLVAAGWASGRGTDTFDGTFKPTSYNAADRSAGCIFCLNVRSPFTLSFNLHMGASVDGPRRFFEMLQNWGNVNSAVVGRMASGSVYVDHGANDVISVPYATPALPLGQTAAVVIKYAAPTLSVFVNGVLNSPPVDVSASPYNVAAAGPVTVVIGGSTGHGTISPFDGLTAHYSAVSLTRPVTAPLQLSPPSGKDRYSFHFTSTSHFGSVNTHAHAHGGALTPVGIAAADLEFVYTNDTTTNTTRLFSTSGNIQSIFPLGAVHVYDVQAGAPFTGVSIYSGRPIYRGGLTVRKNGAVVYQDAFFSSDGNTKYYSYNVTFV